MRQTGIPDSLIAAYCSTHYQAGFGPYAIVLHVDQYSEPLSQFFGASGHRCAAFITACNPLGVRQNPELNRAASARLRNRLNRCVPRPDEIIEGIGFDPSGDWPGEESFLVPGLDIETSRKLGEEFHQNAIVWAGADAVPKLILLR